MDELKTQLSELQLIKPDIERDAPLGVQWLAGQEGHDTLRLMGNPPSENRPSTLEAERKRVQSFIDSKDRVTWMLSYKNTVVGTIWLDTSPTTYLPAPAVHIMIGAPSARGKGIGRYAILAVINFLIHESAYSRIYSRHLTENTAAENLFRKLHFEIEGMPYKDNDHLEWQNVGFNLSTN